MGTSASSNGPGPGVPFDPPWLDDIDIPSSDPLPDDPQQPSKDEGETPVVPDIAPPARFRGARTNLGDYVKSGNRESLRRSLGHYSKTGMGGSKNVASRMRTSTSVGAGLFKTLQSVRDGSNQTLSALFDKLKAEDADTYQFIDAIVENVCPRGGSLDEESCQTSVHSALSDFLDKNPTVDISKLSDDNLWALTTCYLGHEAFNRIQLDIGQSFENKQVGLSERMARLKDMREYIEAEIATQLNALRSHTSHQSTKSLKTIMNTAIKNTFHVFEVEI